MGISVINSPIYPFLSGKSLCKILNIHFCFYDLSPVLLAIAKSKTNLVLAMYCSGNMLFWGVSITFPISFFLNVIYIWSFLLSIFLSSFYLIGINLYPSIYLSIWSSFHSIYLSCIYLSICQICLPFFSIFICCVGCCDLLRQTHIQFRGKDINLRLSSTAIVS